MFAHQIAYICHTFGTHIKGMYLHRYTTVEATGIDHLTRGAVHTQCQCYRLCLQQKW